MAGCTTSSGAADACAGSHTSAEHTAMPLSAANTFPILRVDIRASLTPDLDKQACGHRPPNIGPETTCFTFKPTLRRSAPQFEF